MFDCVAVVGATGAVGTIIRELLEARKFPFKKMKFVASGRSAGRKIPFAGQEIVVEELQGPGLRRRGPGHQQHARRGGPRLHSRRRPPRLRGDRRERLLADGPERAAGDPGGQSARGPPAQGDHRQPQLLDDADGPGPEAAARRRPGPPRGGEHLSGRQRRGPGGQPRPAGRNQGPAGRRRRTSTNASPIRSPSTAFRRSARPSTRATPRKR